MNSRATGLMQSEKGRGSAEQDQEIHWAVENGFPLIQTCDAQTRCHISADLMSCEVYTCRAHRIDLGDYLCYHGSTPLTDQLQFHANQALYWCLGNSLYFICQVLLELENTQSASADERMEWRYTELSHRTQKFNSLDLASLPTQILTQIQTWTAWG